MATPTLDEARFEAAYNAYWLAPGGSADCLRAAISAYLASGPERAAVEMLAALKAIERRAKADGELYQSVGQLSLANTLASIVQPAAAALAAAKSEPRP